MKNNKKGIMMYSSVLIMLLAGIATFGTTRFILNQMDVNANAQIADKARYEAENALVYGVYTSNVKADDSSPNGHKCDDSWFVANKEHEITSEDGNSTTMNNDMTIRRFITFKGTTTFDDATITGIARIYDLSGTLKAEKSVSMKVNLLRSPSGEGLVDKPCNATNIKMDKKTYTIH